MVLDIGIDRIRKTIGNTTITLTEVISDSPMHRGFIIIAQGPNTEDEDGFSHPLYPQIHNRRLAEIKFWQVVRKQMILEGV